VARHATGRRPDLRQRPARRSAAKDADRLSRRFGADRHPERRGTSGYTQVNLALSRRFDNVVTGPYAVRLDVINLFDRVYQIRNGSGVGCSRRSSGRDGGFSLD
jgi:outer membrane receptor protein involved in Fe transport